MKMITFMTEEDLKTMKHGDKLRLATIEELNNVSPCEIDNYVYLDDPGIIEKMEDNFGKEVIFERKRFDNALWFKIAGDVCWYDIRWCIKESRPKYRWRR